MYLINSYIKSNIILFYENFLITSFLKTILINNIKIKKKKIIKKIKKKKNNIKNFFFSYLFKKTKFGYFINKNIFLPNNLLNIGKMVFSKKIFLFEFLFKKIKIENKIFITRRFNFKKKKINTIINNKNYLGIIKNVINYGVFIDIGKADGLLHISEIPYLKKIYNKFITKSIISIKIIKFDKKLKKVSFNLKKNYKKNIEKKFKNNLIKCFIENYVNNGIICYNDKSRKLLLLDKNFLYKKNDILICYYIKKNEKFLYLSLNNKLNKNNFKYQKLIIKYKFNNFILLSYKKIKIIYKKIIFNCMTNKIEFYKFFLFRKINNNFNKIIYINNNYYFKNNNFFIKIKEKKKKYLNISNFYLNKKKFFCFLRKY